MVVTNLTTKLILSYFVLLNYTHDHFKFLIVRDFTVKIYTKTGDDGTTSLARGGRVLKNSARVTAYGSVDELNSHIGWVRAQGFTYWPEEILRQIQNDLFIIGSDLASPPEETKQVDKNIVRMEPGEEEVLEEFIDVMEQELDPLTQFILPGGSLHAAALHVARSVCRRAERDILTLAESETVSPTIIKYINRLSDLLFVMARHTNKQMGVADVPWEKPE